MHATSNSTSVNRRIIDVAPQLSKAWKGRLYSTYESLERYVACTCKCTVFDR